MTTFWKATLNLFNVKRRNDYMNKKITVRRAFDEKVRYCILPSGDLQAQFNIFLFGDEHPSGGYKAEFDGKRLKVIDCIAYDTVTSFEVLSTEDTEDETSPFWIDPETGKTGW